MTSACDCNTWLAVVTVTVAVPRRQPKFNSMPDWTAPATVNLVDLGFMDSRSKLLDLAAFLDRTQRAGQDGDFRVQALKRALALLAQDQPRRVQDVLLSLSDPSTEPVEKAAMQGAIGAHRG